MNYDLIVLGGGPAGYLAAERAGEAGLQVLVIEKEYIGGVCLNVGCIPTKTLLNSAKIYDKAHQGEAYGVLAEDISLDHKKVLSRKKKVVNTLVSGVESSLKQAGVDVLNATGQLVGRENGTVKVAAEGQEYTAENLLIATGSSPIKPGIPGLDEAFENDFVLTSKQLLDVQEVPQSLIIVGGGFIGLEMGSYFNSAGSEVTVIEMLDHIGGQLDRDISENLLARYQDKGINFQLNSRVTEFKGNEVIYEVDGKQQSQKADKVLLSIGRKPVVSGFGLENIGVDHEDGYIKVDETGQTNIPGVYAAGDVNGQSLLAHTAYREAEVCVNNILGQKDNMRYEAIPMVIYTNPEVASVGLTAREAEEQGIDYREEEISMMYSGRYVAENKDKSGICKIIVEQKYQKLIGVHLIGNYTSEIIYGAGMMIENEMRVEDIKEVVFPHPTVSEVLREGIFKF